MSLPAAAESRHTDFLVIGGGIAGLTFALQCHAPVTIVTKKDLPESNTAYAQGGIAASFGEMDSWELHEKDTLVAGAGLCDPEAVRLVTQDGPRLVRWLTDIGAEFDRSNQPGSLPQLMLGREGGHSRSRIVHSTDRTGWEIQRALVTAARLDPFIEVREHCAALSLIVEDGQCLGAWVWDENANQAQAILARATVLAAGGCGQVYRYTTNPPIATGDGIAIAQRAGATLANMEFVQFHPTGLFHPGARSFLISERVRGEGAVLLNAAGVRFMAGVHPLADLAPRDVVALAVVREMRRTGAEHVFLDMRGIGAEKTRAIFPGIYERCMSFGIDVTRDLVPVAPAAHYLCGGIWTDLWGRTSLPRLYACGEVACTGLHGANRLASNSLVEALVFGERAAVQAADLMPAKPSDRLAAPSSWPGLGPDPNAIRERLQVEMSRNVGIIRNDAGLKGALQHVHELSRLRDAGELTSEGLEAANLSVVAAAIIECALMRRESRGTHFNEDCPERDDLGWSRPTLLARAGTPQRRA